LRPGPFVFFNACQSAQGGLTLTGVGGWAQRFIRPSFDRFAAAAFIGSYWSVYDEAAHAFATSLYPRIFAGEPIGEAVKEARRAVRSAADPLTWLAYTVYADPLATEEGIDHEAS
jgi:CHAT domain-containing protein